MFLHDNDLLVWVIPFTRELPLDFQVEVLAPQPISYRLCFTCFYAVRGENFFFVRNTLITMIDV